jgi:L,D-transpeptidase catalytic domain/Putative peptidoglycan binding domain
VLKILIVLFVLLIVLIGAGVAAAWRYDAGHDDRLAEGISIAGVEVGGMRAAEARRLLRARVEAPLAEPIAIGYRSGQFVFEPETADVDTNIDALVDRALARSRSGNFLMRAFRDATGGKVAQSDDVDISYSRAAVDRFASRIARQVDTKPREGKSKASFAGVRVTPSKNGVEVMKGALIVSIAHALVDAGQRRTFKLPTRVLHPKVTTRELEQRYRVFLAVSRSQKELRYFVKEKLVKTYRVAIGRIGFETPAGLYEIKTKAVNPAWYVPKESWAGDLAGKIIPPGDPENPLKARWMGFWDGAGIHGTAESDSIGSAASHGCIRMTVPDVVELYARVPLHTPLYIS